MLKSLFFDAYRSIRGPTKLDLAGISLLCGPNSAGKSSVIKALKFFKAFSSAHPWTADKSGGPVRRFDSGHIYQDQMRIGIEFVPNDVIPSGPRYEAHLNALQAADSELHFFWERVFDKSIKVFVQCGDNETGLSDKFELYIDDQLVLQIDNDCTFLDPFFRPTREIDDSLINLEIFGNIKIHNLLVVAGLSPYESEEESAISKLVFEKKGEWSTIRGLKFNYFTNKPESDYNSLIAPDPMVLDFLPSDRDTFAKDVAESYTGREVLKISEASYRAWLNEVLGHDQQSIHNTINSALWQYALKLRFFLESLFIRLESALNFRHAAGSRSLIDSRTPYHVADKISLIGEYTFPNQDFHVRDYLYWWWGKSRTDQPDDLESANESSDDIVQAGFSNLMPSLGRYSLRLQIYQIVGIDGPKNYMQPLPNPIQHELTSGALVHPYLNSPSTGRFLLDFRDVGSGLSFMFPIFSCLTVGRLSIVEQPELHLHPRAQCELGDVFIYALSHGRSSVVETHSEHMILRLSRRIRETNRGQLIKKELQLQSSDVNIYYFAPGVDGVTTIHKIRFDEQGEFLDVWPDGFFAERGKELFS